MSSVVEMRTLPMALPNVRLWRHDDVTQIDDPDPQTIDVAAKIADSFRVNDEGGPLVPPVAQSVGLMALITLLTQCIQELIKNREAGNAQSAFLAELVQNAHTQRATEQRSAGNQELVGALCAAAAIGAVVTLGAVLSLKGANKELELQTRPPIQDAESDAIEQALSARTPMGPPRVDDEVAWTDSASTSNGALRTTVRRQSGGADMDVSAAQGRPAQGISRGEASRTRSDSHASSDDSGVDATAHSPQTSDADADPTNKRFQDLKSSMRQREAGRGLSMMAPSLGVVLSSGFHVSATGARAQADMLQASSSSTETAKGRLDEQARSSDAALSRTQGALHDILASNEQVLHRISTAVAA